MALLLRKVWGSVLSRLGSTSDRSSSESPVDYPSMGAFDQLPIDVFMQILRCLGPKEVARTSPVCKSWKLLASDNRLWIFFLQNGREPWDSVLFSETHLRLGSSSM